MLSQIFILSARGDTIINRDFRSDLIKNTPELFFRSAKMYQGDAPPIFNLQGINFAYLKKQSLYLVATSRFNVSPSSVLELLNRIYVILKDFLGTVSEEMIRKNFVLVYEILDEIIDFGQPQLTSTQLIRPLIVNQLVTLDKESYFKKLSDWNIFSSSTAPSGASNVSINKNKQNQIYVDVIEKVNMLFNASGYLINSSVDGYIQMKSYLHGNPNLKLSLNDDLVLAGNNNNTSANVVIQDCNFHQNVNYTEFDLTKTLKMSPPQGEMVVMNYRVTTDFNAPFRIFATFQQATAYKLHLIVKLKATFGKQTTASFVNAKFTIPSIATSVSTQIIKNQGNQLSEYKQSSRTVEWNIKKMTGGSQYTLIAKITLPQASVQQAQKQAGPINLNFQIPMHNVSGLQIKGLNISQQGSDIPPPHKWIRYITKSTSYVCRI